MSNTENLDNDVNEVITGGNDVSSGRCFTGEQGEPGRNQATARTKWEKEVNKVVMECYFRSKPVDENGVPIRGYRRRMFQEWRNRGMFQSSKQRICDQKGL